MFLCIESNEETDALFFEESNFNKKKVVATHPNNTNTYDAFKIIIPKEEEYLELSLCIDSREYIESFITRLESSSQVMHTLELIKEGISKVFISLLEFMQNKLKGKIRVEYGFGEIVLHRQEMVAKVGILNHIFTLLDLINQNIATFEDKDDILEVLEISPEDFSGFENLLEVIIKTIHISSLNNSNNIIQCICNMSKIQNFVFVEGCTTLLIDIFKDKNFELNKKEIHSELLYRRIFEIERFESVIDHFITKVKTVRDFNSLLILRKMCIIDGNSLPLVQDTILERLYMNSSFLTKYVIEKQNESLVVISNSYNPEISETQSISEFFEFSSIDERIFLLEQLSLEADMCFGRNETCKEYFRKIYPCSWLIDNTEDNTLNIDLRGKFIRLLNYLYIDDPPHKLLKMSRAFKAYESTNQYISEISSTRSKHLTNQNLEDLINFIKEYIEAFARKATGVSYIKSFDMELVRLINYLLRFGLFIYRGNVFQSADVDLVFSFLCHI